MRGQHHIVIESARLKYEFDIRRNITIIQGDSATGKTTLIELLRDYANDRSGETIRLQSDVPCVVFGGDQNYWKPVLRSIEQAIVFIDEDYTFILSKEFAEVVKNSSNYYVLITRRSLPNLPYSIQEIYGIRTSGKYHFPEKIYHEFYPIYEDSYECNDQPGLLLVEDSRAGYQFFENICEHNQCVSAEGNSNIYQMLLINKDRSDLLVIADGAAFGAYAAAVVSFAKAHGHTMLYFPECFEWLILCAEILSIPELRGILEQPERYIESSEYFSWERYFVSLLENETAHDDVKRYNKNHLAEFYLRRKNKDMILSVMPKEVRDALPLRSDS